MMMMVVGHLVLDQVDSLLWVVMQLDQFLMPLLFVLNVNLDVQLFVIQVDLVDAIHQPWKKYLNVVDMY
jgi:hypothetical protein